MTWRLLRPIWRIDNITASRRLVLLALASFTDQRGANAYPSQVTLARMCCCSRSTIKRALVELVRRGLISPQGKGRKGTIRYSVALSSMTYVEAHSDPPTRPTVTYNPSNSNPGNYPSEKNYDYFNPDSGDSQPRYHRRTRQELVDEEQRERAAMRARLDARNKR
jgi:DNA-binding transcriptional MocR family regulator